MPCSTRRTRQCCSASSRRRQLRDAWPVASEVDAIVDAWLELAEATPWPVLTAPGVVLDRTPLALTVDALVGIAALTAALWTGWFHWPGNPESGATGDAEIGPYEASVVECIRSRDDLLGFALRVARGWRAGLAEHGQTLRDDPAQTMRTPRGELALVELLEAQRLHCAGHYRQATATPRRRCERSTSRRCPGSCSQSRSSSGRARRTR